MSSKSIVTCLSYWLEPLTVKLVSIMASSVCMRHLSEQGHDISTYMVRSIKEEFGIKCRRHKRFKVTTNSSHNKLIYPNVLDQKFDAKIPNEAWVSEAIYLKLLETL